MNAIKAFEQFKTKQLQSEAPDLRVGDKVKVHILIKEGSKERIQIFQGHVIAMRGGQSIGASFTVRKVSYGIGVERIFPLHSPLVKQVEVLSHGKVRRAKLYYLRKLSGKAARIPELRRDFRKKK